MSVVAEMPRYKCHKEVGALRIAAIEIHEDKSATIASRDLDYTFKTSPGWAERWKGSDADTGYYVVYDDGYASWSPTKAFEEGYTRTSAAPELNGIGWALKQMHNGSRVRRRGWNGKGMWLALSGLDGVREINASAFWSPANRAYAEEQGGAAKVLPCITMKTATAEILMGWLASQTDLLATDWEIAD